MRRGSPAVMRTRVSTCGRTGTVSWRPVRHTAGVPLLRIAQDPAADELLGRDPLALLLGMLLDQHVLRRSSGVGGRLGAGGAAR